MGSGGGGGDNGMMMMMMMLQMEQQKKEMERQQAAQMFAASQKAEGQNYQRYQDQITNQNKKVGDQWDLYNANMDKILKLNPGYNANKRYTFNGYTINPEYRKSTNQGEADANTDLLTKWYSDLDRQSLDDYNMAKSQYDASKTWLGEVQAAKDAEGRVLGNAPAGTWGAGGGMVSGGAGADSQNKDPNASAGFNVGGGAANPDVYSNFASAGNAGASSSGGQAGSNVGMGGGLSGSGFLGGSDSPGSSSLAGLMGQAIGGAPNQNKTGAGTSIF
jgi:hypothetical protein